MSEETGMASGKIGYGHRSSGGLRYGTERIHMSQGTRHDQPIGQCTLKRVRRGVISLIEGSSRPGASALVQPNDLGYSILRCFYATDSTSVLMTAAPFCEHLTRP